MLVLVITSNYAHACVHDVFLAYVLCLLHDAHTDHTLQVLELQPPPLAFQHGVYVH